MVHHLTPIRPAALLPRVALRTSPRAIRSSDAAPASKSPTSTLAKSTSASTLPPTEPDFRSLFTDKTTLAVPDPPAAQSPTAESVFGANPWVANPGGQAPNGVNYSYNPYYFATPATAAKVAQMVGGKVVETNAITPFGPFVQNQPNQMVQLPNGRLINAGLVASFYDHGYSQQFIDRLVTSEVEDRSA
jgi:hypothetical protein